MPEPSEPSASPYLDPEDAEFEVDQFNLRDTDFFDINELNSDNWRYQDAKGKRFNDFFFMDRLVIAAMLLYKD